MPLTFWIVLAEMPLTLWIALTEMPLTFWIVLMECNAINILDYAAHFVFFLNNSSVHGVLVSGEGRAGVEQLHLAS